MKAIAIAPANIAFIKFWGKKDERLRIPYNPSISMNLSSVFTKTTVEFNRSFKSDNVIINGLLAKSKEKDRVIKFLDQIRDVAKVNLKAKIVSKNNFPKGAGIASSASGFAALTLASTNALGLNLNTKELSILARLGSGSACRSIPDGFVEWKAGKNSLSSYAYSLYPPDYWDIRDVVLIIEDKDKKVSSTEGHAIVESSPFFKTRIKGINKKVRDIKTALRKKDFTAFGNIVEEEAVNMHTVMMTSRPPLFYWLPTTLEVILAIRNWRDEGIESYYTIDAGPNVHVFCEGRNLEKLLRKLKVFREIKEIIVNKPAIGARIVS